MSDEIRPFKIQVSEAELEDVKMRLRAARWPEPQTVPDWSQGVPLDYLLSRNFAPTWMGSPFTSCISVHRTLTRHP
jgi:hypothetical protein